MATPLNQQIIFKIGGSISCIGSGYIIQDVLRNPDKRSKSVYHRIMVGLSAMDIFFSFFAFVLGSWPMPKGSWLWAAGNMASCDAAGFIAVFGYIGSPLYNCSLATYYSLQLKYNWQDHRIKSIQKWFHIVPCSIAFLICTIGLCTKSFGPLAGYCGPILADYPRGCSNEPDSEVKCIRSAGMIDVIIIMIGYLVPFICLLYVSITMLRIYRTIRHIEVNALKHSFMTRFRAEQDKKKNMKRSRRIMIQGVLYSVAMILTWTFTFISIIIIFISNEANPIIRLISNVVSPLQGAYNCLIYLMPFFRKMLKTHRQQKKHLENEALNKNENEEKNAIVNCISPLSGTTLIQPKDSRRKSVYFEEKKEEEKKEIAPLPPVFSLETSENGQDEGTGIYEFQNNKDDINDDDNDYY